MSKQKKWVPAQKIDPNIFQLPSKSSKAVTIQAPQVVPDDLGSGHTHSFVENKGRASVSSRKASVTSGSASTSTHTQSLDPTPAEASGDRISYRDPTQESVGLKNEVTVVRANGVAKEHGASKTKDALSNGLKHDAHLIRSNLDIYAQKYIPYWLKAINESVATTVHAEQIVRIDLDEYRASFCGTQLRQHQPFSSLPPPQSVNLSALDPLLETYRLYWNERLQNEYTAQAAQNDAFALFAIDVELVENSKHVYKFEVPGLRENTPRVDLGDILLVRPFLPMHLPDISEQALQWSQHRRGFAPQFIGMEHHAVVYSVLRRDEVVIVRLGRPLPKDLKCNVVFPLQAHKNYPSWRAVDTTSSLLQHHSGSWLSSILFPSNGVLQKTLSKGSFSLDWADSSLNFEQKRAVQAVIDDQYGTVPYLVSGPPGTGKTKTMVEATLQLLRSQRYHRPHILVCAPSDAAADVLLMRLSQHLSQKELFRLNNWTRLAGEVPGEVRPYCCIDANQLFALPDFETLMSYKVVVTACRDANVLVQAGLSNADLASMTLRILNAVACSVVDSVNLLHWSALILDEAAQATEPEALVCLSVIAPYGETSLLSQDQVPQVIMAGDEYQLGPRLISSAVSGQLGVFDTIGLEKSMFQRVFERPLYANHPLSRSHGLRPLTKAMLPITRPPFSNLIRNYRSHPAILTTSSALFYSDTLIPERPATSPAILSWPGWPKRVKGVWPVMFFQNTGPDSVESVTEGDGTGSGSLTNHTEALIVQDLVTELLDHVNTPFIARVERDYLRDEDIIILSPYRAQVNNLRQLFRKAGRYDIRIGPLEAFQGLEARVVVICTTRTRLGQQPHSPAKFVNEDRSKNLGIINQSKSFNVAMTRAQEALIVVGNAEVLTVTRDPCWVHFLRFCERNGLCNGGKVSWFGKSAGRVDTSKGMGKLERALKYSEDLEASGMSNGHSGDSTDFHDGLAKTARQNGDFKFTLKGRMIDMDDRMWEEMQVGAEETEAIKLEEDLDASLYGDVVHDDNDFESDYGEDILREVNEMLDNSKIGGHTRFE